MALNAQVLEDELLAQAEAAASGQLITYGDFVSALEKYGLMIQYPPPIGVPAGSLILKNILDSIPTKPPLPIAVPLMKLAIQMFAFSISAGAPVGTGLIFPTKPPPGIPQIDSILSKPNSKEQVAKELANAIHTYMIGGQYDATGLPPAGSFPGQSGYTSWT